MLKLVIALLWNIFFVFMWIKIVIRLKKHTLKVTYLFKFTFTFSTLGYLMHFAGYGDDFKYAYVILLVAISYIYITKDTR